MGGEWRVTTLGEVLTLQRGFDLPEADRRPGRFPVIASTGQVGTHDEAMVLGPGVVIGRSGSLGGGQFIEDDFWPLNTTLWVKDFKGNDPRFCYYLLRSLDLSQFNAGSGVPTLNRNHIHPLPVVVPSDLNEQRAIAHILGTLDDKIELNRHMNQTLEEMARAIFKSWFVDFDPVRAKATVRCEHTNWSNAQVSRAACPNLKPEIAELFPDEFENSELGEIPKGWEIKRFSELTSVITKGTTPTQEEIQNAPRNDIKINYLRVNCIEEDGSILADKLTNIPKSVHVGVLKRSILKCDDILYTIAGTIGRIALTEDWILPANTNQAIAIIRPNPYIPPGFLVLTMQQEAFRQELHNNIVHAVQANLSLGILSKAKAVIPSVSTLSKLFEPVQDIQSKVISNRTQSRTLAALRDTVLPKLISGELRVKDAEKIVGRAV